MLSSYKESRTLSFFSEEEETPSDITKKSHVTFVFQITTIIAFFVNVRPPEETFISCIVLVRIVKLDSDKQTGFQHFTKRN